MDNKLTFEAARALLLDRTEPVGTDTLPLVSDDFERGIVERRRGSADGKNGQAGDQPEKVQAASVAELQKKPAERAVVGKEPHVVTS